MSEGLVSALFSYVCTCRNFVSATSLGYTSPLHVSLCVQNANLSLLHVPAAYTCDMTSCGPTYIGLICDKAYNKTIEFITKQFTGSTFMICNNIMELQNI